jgi:pyruvate/2-oxoglutarate dehydrogenase complex dihydrolipoamide acyltransferase (E2) component
VKLGTENKNKTIAAVSLGVLALIMVVYRFISPTGGAPPVPTANQSGAASAASAAAARPQPRKPVATNTKQSGSTKKVALTPSLDPTLRLALLRTSEDTKYTGAGRNIFRAEIDIPKPVQPVAVTPAPQQPQVYVPPPPPPIPLKFFGFASKPGEPKRIFLSADGDVFIAAEGDIVDRRYKVLHITPSSVEIEDVLNNNRQSIPLTQG